MRACGFFLALGVSLAAVTSAGASREAAALRLVDRAPLTVRGTGFEPRDTVRVTVRGEAVATRVVRATAAGAFVARFQAVAVDRCSAQRVVAVARAGDRAELKLLPSPACPPG